MKTLKRGQLCEALRFMKNEKICLLGFDITINLSYTVGYLTEKEWDFLLQCYWHITLEAEKIWRYQP